jgi:hypothetical protein
MSLCIQVYIYNLYFTEFILHEETQIKISNSVSKIEIENSPPNLYKIFHFLYIAWHMQSTKL